MSPFLSEILGTAILIILGNGVVANVLLSKTKGHDSGLIVIAIGWAVAVFVGVYIAAPISGAHLNPAVTIGLAVAGKFTWGLVAPYIIAQMIGAMLGAFVVWISYRDHYTDTTDQNAIRATFCTSPAIDNKVNNIITESIATFILVFGVLYITAPSASLGALDALPVAILVLGIGVGLGGPTGYAINPARDLGPRIVHQILPIKSKGNSEWSYSMVPVIGPILGATIAGLIFSLLQ